jgi:hypothetical protein
MKTPRIYVDTSVLGGCFDREFAPWSNGLLEDFRARRFVPVLSDLLATEIARAPEMVRTVHEELRALGGEQIAVDPAALELLSLYEQRSSWGRSFAPTCCTSHSRPWWTSTCW